MITNSSRLAVGVVLGSRSRDPEGMLLEVSPGFGLGGRAQIFLILWVKLLVIERVFE